MNNKPLQLKGLYTALVTPFTKNNKIDYTALENLIQHQLDAKVDGIVILGTTGEKPTIDAYEKHKLIKFVENLTHEKTTLIIGAGSNDTEQTINEVKGLSIYNADAILLSCPEYSKPTKEGLYNHFKRIADESYKPIILYNIPQRTGISIPISVIEKLCSHPNIIGIKDASSNISYAIELSKLASKDFVLLSGNDNLTLPLSSLGFTGCISVLSNALPYEMKFLIDLINQEKYKTARIIHNHLLPLMNICFIESNPIPIKYMLYKMKLIKNKLRLPLCPLSKINRKKIDKLLDSFYK